MGRWIVTVVLSGAVACAQVPYTGRSQLVLISEADEVRLGAQAFAEVLQKSRIDRDAAISEPVEDVGRRLAAVAGKPGFRWTFVALDDPKTANAFCLPGGKVGVYTGLFPIALDETGLAVVMGHEIAHAIARHGAERMSQGIAAQMGGAVLGAALGTGPSADLVLSAYGLGAQVGVLLPYGRTQESEADHIGLLLMAQAGYDPRRAVAFWARMEQSSRDGGPPEFLSTHPSHETRAHRIEVWMPEATALYDAAIPAPSRSLPRIADAR